ncbi:MAG: DUF2867 domain-containing protein [Gemmatimonadales bacterium]|nr:DUF2867 domain-containing protein [Gemmatimonadales bacterium]
MPSHPRVPTSEFRALDLRAHEFLSDAPLHDVWRIRLSGGGPDLTVAEVVDQFVEVIRSAVETGAGGGSVVRALFGIRSALGRAFGWDRKTPASLAPSYLDRLSGDDRARTLETPGSKRYFWTTLYAFEREALGEVINQTVHSFLLFALEPSEGGGGYTLYWATYVKPVSWFTPFYMAVIDPFRRLLIYPALIRRFEASWKTRCEGDPDSRPIVEGT